MSESDQRLIVAVDLVLARVEYRDKGWYGAADIARDFIRELGFDVNDTNAGTDVLRDGRLLTVVER